MIGTTCLGIKHAVFSRRRFDVCFVDEASQIQEVACLGPMRTARVFVLVGDHHQLPPLVRSPASIAGGMGVSLFKRLSDAHPHAVATLALQYRMNEEVQAVCNTLVYDGALRCGDASVAESRLALPHPHRAPQPRSGAPHWLPDVVAPGRPVVFANTDSAAPGAGLEARLGSLRGGVAQPSLRRGICNQTEAVLTAMVVHTLVRCGVPARSIGVIAPYRAQLQLLRAMLADATVADVEVETVDRYQGRDKRCMVVSLVRSNTNNEVRVFPCICVVCSTRRCSDLQHGWWWYAGWAVAE